MEEKEKIQMATKASKRTKRIRPTVNVTHELFGPGILLEKRVTDSNQTILVVRFSDATRSVLAAPEFWQTTPAQLAAIPIKTSAPAAEPDEIEENREPNGSHDDVEEAA
jgi:hypothetical protein